MRGCGFSSLNLGSLLSLSTVCKPRSPKPVTPVAPPFSSSSGVLGNGLCELDRLLQELNATQFNITGTGVTESVLNGLETGQRRAESEGHRLSEEQLKAAKPSLGGWEGVYGSLPVLFSCLSR